MSSNKTSDTSALKVGIQHFFLFPTKNCTSSDMSALKAGGRNFPLAAGKTPMSCSSGLKGASSPRGKVFLTFVMSLKSEAKGA